MNSWKTRKVGLAAAIGGLALGAAAISGVVYAQTGPGGSTPTPGARAAQAQANRQQFLNDLAGNLGVDPSKLQDALKTTAKQEVDRAVQAGKLTASEGQNIKNAIDSGKMPAGLFGRGVPGGGAMGALGQNAQAIQQAVQTALSQVLPGETADQLRSDLRSGKTLDQIAQAHGTTAQGVKDAVANAVKGVLDPLVQQQQITQQQEDNLLNAIRNGKGPGFFFGARGGHGHGGRSNPNGNGSTTPTT